MSDTMRSPLHNAVVNLSDDLKVNRCRLVKVRTRQTIRSYMFEGVMIVPYGEATTKVEISIARCEPQT